MKKSFFFLVVSNIILLLFVALALVKMYQTPLEEKQTKDSSNTKEATSSSKQGIKFGYFHMDSIELKSKYVLAVKKEIQKIISKNQLELNNIGKIYLTQRNRLKNVSQKNKYALEQEVETLEEKYNLLKISNTQRLKNLYDQYDVIVRNNIRDISAKYCKEKQIEFLFSYEDGFMFSVQQQDDITDELITRMNKDYSANKSSYKLPFR